jgi:hypothetical protein
MLERRSCPDDAAGRHALACLVAAHESHARGGAAVRIAELSDVARERVFAWA